MDKIVLQPFLWYNLSMNILTGVGILLLSMLIIGFLQLRPSILMIFLHYASAKYSKMRTSDLALFYIFGVEFFVASGFILLYYITTISLQLLPDIGMTIIYYILLIVLLIIGISFPFLYFRRGAGTRLFISRKIAASLTERAKKTKTRSDAFMLGFSAGLPELVLTIPLYLLSTIIIADLSEYAAARAGIIILFIMVAVLPLFIIRALFAHHYNLANIQMFREKNKTFYCLMLCVMYILTAAMVLMRIYA